MNSIIGFSIHLELDPAARERQHSALLRALSYFPWLQSRSLKIGASCLQVWGHGRIDELVIETGGGERLVIIGSPVGDISVNSFERLFRSDAAADGLTLPCDGRVTLLKVSSDGRRWTMWNDWAGSIPVFHARVGKGRIASTLEPVVVAAGNYSPDDFFLPGLLSLLLNGHFLGDWTLFKDMKVVPPDVAAEWEGERFSWRRLWTVKPTTERWESGWDDLVEEMHDLFRRAIAEALKTQPAWILPLSGGLDSRLIAAVGAETGAELHAYTYGRKDWIETIYARQVATALQLPWRRVPIDPDHLARHTRMWLEWFGSATHCHGMYQMPFLEAVREVHLPITTGFTGDPLAGAQTAIMMSGSADRPMLERLMDKWQCCSIEDARRLLKAGFSDALDAINAELGAQESAIPGSLFQRAWLIFQWNHVFGFSYYQPMMYDYWKGVGTPFMNRSLAQFCLSLPRCALDNRRLQKEMLRRYYPSMALIGGTFGEVIQKGGKYLVKQRVALKLPTQLRRGPFQEFSPDIGSNTIQTDALQAHGEDSLWPVNEVRQRMSDWFNMDVLEQTYDRAASGDEAAYLRLRPIQAIARHFVHNRG
ncbi:MAG TPA: asparagine synthase C-terminal domain-containing protein [Pyrinomonadaceae bacterium]|nr:asparagine synthase C-terminal domain-containing protein [Pyrinomonadaceae bacterium]